MIKNKQIQIRCKGTSTLPLDSLQNFQGNLKELRESEYKKLRRSIEKYGFRFPVFVWKNFILDGHQRIFTIKKMVSEGWLIDPIPVIEIEAENEKEAKRLVLLISSRYGHVTDEGLYEFIMTSELDFNELKEEIDLPEIDFKQFEQSYFTDEPQDAEPQIDRAEELNKKWQVKTGDIWQIGEHRLLCGDSTKVEDVVRVMEGKKATLAAVDPPYNVGKDYDGKTANDEKTAKKYEIFSHEWFEECQKVSIRQIVTPGCVNLSSWCRWFEPYYIAPWIKTNSMTNGKTSRFWCWEPIFFFGDKWPRRRSNDVFDFPIGSQKEVADHPCPKPLKMWGDILENYSEQGDIIYEAFGGSGTTMVACQNLNRKCRGIEISPAYCSVILQRMEDAFGITGVRI